jgi:hypothetical protein
LEFIGIQHDIMIRIGLDFNFDFWNSPVEVKDSLIKLFPETLYTVCTVLAIQTDSSVNSALAIQTDVSDQLNIINRYHVPY